MSWGSFKVECPQSSSLPVFLYSQSNKVHLRYTQSLLLPLVCQSGIPAALHARSVCKPASLINVMRKLLEPSLYYFSVVAQTGSLTSATEKLGLTVSALSRHIAKLEGDIGVPLFERHARGMVLSHAGRLLFRHAQRTLADAQAVFDEIQGDERRRARTLTIACTEGFAFDFLPVSLGAFCAQQPDVAIRLEVVPAERASQLLLSGEASIGLAFTFKPEPGVLVQFTQRAGDGADARRSSAREQAADCAEGSGCLSRAAAGQGHDKPATV